MKIIEPKIELLEQTDEVAHVARCARICYRKETGNDKALYDSLIKRNHLSMFRHLTYYFIVPYECAPKWLKDYFNAICFGAKIIGIDIDYVSSVYYVVTNGNWNLDHKDLLIDINNFMVTAKEFANTNKIAYNMIRYTFKVTTQISTSRELNRVSPNNISEQSTRYVYEDGTICRPYWMTVEEANYLNIEPIFDDDWIENHTFAKRYIWTVDNSFHKYKLLIDKGMHCQNARGVLPLDTATVCAYTYSWKEWEEIIKKRVYNTTGKAHPNATIICKLIEQKLNELDYEVH